ncbi:MAG: galactose mutarotase [Clostridiales Family XIII bacterium]|jgi:aldose 1-epimerase|nr:galactose mutarotase [Clostridiales Family XIII bacterium]
MSFTVQPLGNSAAKLYTFRNKNGMELAVTNIGAAVTKIVAPAADGQKIDVALGYDSAEGYENNRFYYGATIGRYGNRIGGASFKLGDTVVRLDKNEGNNTLHGGFDSYSNRVWQAEERLGEETSVTFRLKSPDGDQGMPGAADVAVTYSLTDDNSVVIHYRAVADKTTVFNMTNHSYFNLDGHDAGSVAGQFIWLDCDAFVVIDKEFIPTGELRPVKSTPMDFTTAKPIGRDVDADYEQLTAGGGYDHNYVINSPSLDKPCARAWSEKSGVEMRVYTDLPGVQLYGGNGMGGDSAGKSGARYVRRGGFCLETQYFPDSPNKPAFPSSVFEAGQPFDSVTIYRFSVAERRP